MTQGRGRRDGEEERDFRDAGARAVRTWMVEGKGSSWLRPSGWMEVELSFTKTGIQRKSIMGAAGEGECSATSAVDPMASGCLSSTLGTCRVDWLNIQM